jgi:hypothetical protein
VELARGKKRVLAATPTAAIDVGVAKGVTYVLGEQKLFRLSGSTLTELLDRSPWRRAATAASTPC